MRGRTRNRRTGPRALALLAPLLAAAAACSDSTSPDPWPAEEGAWAALGEGLTGSASAFLEWEGDLVVGGLFLTAGDQPARNVARWDGSLWHPLGTGLDGPVQGLADLQGDLVAVGFFGADRSRAYRFDGERWRPLGLLQDGGIMDAAVHDGVLYAGGSNLARWTGSAWQAVQVEVDGVVQEAGPPFVAHDGYLVAGAGSDGLARWDGQAWSWMERPSGLWALVAGDGELFALAAGLGVPQYLRWNGSGWDALESTPERRSWTVHEGDLVVGLESLGSNYLARWTGSQWSPLPGEMDGRVTALGSYGRALIAGGEFTAIQGSPYRGIAGIVP